MESKVLQAVSYAEENFNLFVEQLKDLVRIPSVSFPGFDHSKIDDSAKLVAELFSKTGLENVEILKIPNCFPYIYADWIHKKDAPTILLYAHHDVQPPMRVELWETPPFEPSERNGRLYGRGSADDKAGVLVHIASIASYLKTVGELPINVKIIIEGEEEIGSSHLLEFLKVYKEKLKADAIILTDLANFDTGIPSLTTSLRGLVAIQVELYSTESPLHSGLWGGAIPDPIMGLCKVISGLTDEKGNIAIPEIYEMVKPTTQEELDDMKKLELTEELFRQQAKMVEGTQLVGGDFHLLEKMWKRPSLLVNCIQSGERKNTGNVLMDSAWAKIGIRTVPFMDSDKVLELLIKKIKSLVPWGLKVEIIKTRSGGPWTTETKHPIFEKAKKSLSRGYGKDTVLIGCGASIPFVEPFSKELGGIPALLVGVEDPYTNAHSENESLDLNDFKKAILGQIYFFGSF